MVRPIRCIGWEIRDATIYVQPTRSGPHASDEVLSADGDSVKTGPVGSRTRLRLWYVI
jgi:hypothetical protein